ncbi:MAG: HAMP domain-containing protein, partial [Chitinophagaceae bacterium]|nr:HAMP domain-containing protein [Chitinophagaceae bacterium]
MNLKLRFALLFSSFVAGILLIACASIYFLYASYRQEDYFNRVELEGEDLYEIYQSLSNKNANVQQDDVLELHRIALINEHLFVLDSNQSLIFSLGVNTAVDIPKINFEKVKKQGKLEIMDSAQNQIVATYKPEQKEFLITEAYDRVGLKKVYTMSIILSGVFGGSLLLTAVISFLFVQQAIKPIVELSDQMQRTNVFNLSERITVKPAKDEIYAIAKNFNAMLERIRTGFEYRKSFVQHSSHELRTPLAVMLSQTEAALNNVNDVEGFRKVLLSLKEDQQHLIELTNALLQISQNEQLEFVENWPALRV